MIPNIFQSISVDFLRASNHISVDISQFFVLQIIFQSISVDFQNHIFLPINIGTILGENISIDFDISIDINFDISIDFNQFF